MQKIILIISRTVFLSVLGLFTFFVFYWELFTLSSVRTQKLTINSKIDLGNLDKTLIGQALAKEEEKDSTVESRVAVADARPVMIRKYLEKYKSPLVPYSDLIFELSQNYGFEYYWIVAIAQQESNLCKKIPDGSFNCWGYGIHKKGTLKFENYELALKSYAEYLKREYFDKGLNTPELIMKKYCPSSNGSWAFGVQHFIEEIQSGNF